MCMYVYTYHWAPGRVAFRLKAAPVKIRIFILYPLNAAVTDVVLYAYECTIVQCTHKHTELHQ